MDVGGGGWGCRAHLRAEKTLLWEAKQADLCTKLSAQTGSLACLCRLGELLARLSAQVLLVYAISQVVRQGPKLPQQWAEV